MKRMIVIAVLSLLMLPAAARAAIGCTLNDPDRDIGRMFPGYTSYKTEFNTIADNGGEALKAKIEKKLGDELDPDYESVDVEHALYTVYKDKKVIGYVFGVNQRGVYGVMQVIIAANTKGVIKDWYYQKISHPEAGKLRAADFREQFAGMTLADFEFHREHYPGTAAGCELDDIENPLTEGKMDFQNTLRGLMLDLILFSEFKLNK